MHKIEEIYYHNSFNRRLNPIYRNDPKFSDRLIWANSADPDQTPPRLEEQSDQGLHCLLFNLHLFDEVP